VKWDTGLQLVEIKTVLVSGVKVMHASKQPNKKVKTLDHVRDVDSAEQSFVLWGSDYLLLISAPPIQKNKLLSELPGTHGSGIMYDSIIYDAYM
jgi:hypothetical protein